MDEPTPPRPSWTEHPAVRTGAEAAAFAMLALAAVGLALFGGRREIARQFAEDWLRERGVEAGFSIESVDSGAFVGRVRLGPERDPVFSAERVEVAYDLTPPWAGAPFKLSTRAVRLVKPRIKVAWNGREFSAGPLDPLIKEFLARPPSDDPGPAVLVEDAHISLATPNGLVRVTGDAAIDDGDLLRLDGRLLPARLRGEDFEAVTEGGSVRLRQANGVVTADVRLALGYAGGGMVLADAEAAVEGTLPYPDMKAKTVSGPVALRAAVVAGRAAGEAGYVSAPVANARLAGTASGGFDALAFTGRLTGAARAGVAVAEAGRAADLRAGLDLAGLTLRRDGAAGSGKLTFDTGRAEAAGLVLARTATRADLRFDGAAFNADAALSAQGGYPAAEARRLAEAVPVVSGDPVQAAAIAAALRDFDLSAPRVRLTYGQGSMIVALRAPATATSASGGRAVVSPRGGPLLADGRGAFDLALAGGGLPRIEAEVASYALENGGLDARLAVRAKLDAPPAQDAEADLDGRLLMGGGRTVFTLSGCGDAGAARVAFGETPVEHVRARLCPVDLPLVSAGGGSWRLAGRFERLQAAAVDVRAEGASGRFDITGSDEMDTAAVELAVAQVSDTQGRFNPLRVGARMTLSGGVWRGTLPVETASGRPLARVSLSHDVAAERGQAEVDATGLAFKPDGLQPADLSPLAATFGAADGTAAFTGRLAWTKGVMTSGGVLDARNLTFSSPAGTVMGLNSKVAFTSLAPLATAPGQVVTVDGINAIVPLSSVSGTFAIADDAIGIAAFTATAAKGTASLEPMSIPLKAGETIRGVMVLDDVDVGEIVAGSTMAEKMKIDAIVDGRLPFAVGPDGVRVQDGRLAAIKPGRISIDRTALTSVETGEPANPMDATPPAAEVNAIQDFAYQAMENLAFETLEAGVDSVDGGRLAVLFRIKGRHDPAVAEQARVGLRELLNGKAFQRRIPLPKGTPVDLTLDTSLNFDQLLADWRNKWRSDAVQPQGLEIGATGRPEP